MNLYDDPEFFKKYSQMSRSTEGLAGAGEWETLVKVLPDFTNKTVLDLGCGYGWHCNYAVEQGAEFVISIDQSEKMLEVAKNKYNSPKIRYIKTAIENLNFPDKYFDVVISSLALHYIKDYERLIQRVSQIIKNGGHIVFTVEHPIFTAHGSQDWYYGDDGEILHFPVDHYFIEGEREAIFLNTKMTKYHRTLTTYLEVLINNEFTIKRILEPEPTEKILKEGKLNDEMRRPMMLIISAVKNRNNNNYLEIKQK